jgi:hypothetical protein
MSKAFVESLCRSEPSHSSDTTIPRVFVPKFFDLGKRATYQEASGFISFLDAVLSMPRAQYKRLISCLCGFFEALEVVGKNFDLAYSIMVYLLEALSASIQHPLPDWKDYDQNIRLKLDEQLENIDSKVADNLRNILLSNPNMKKKRRFVDFVASHVDDAFFTSEAEGLLFPPAKSEMRRALANLYDARSGYVHELKEVQQQLKLNRIGTDGDVFHWLHEPYFTFPGLVRLSRHVLMTFIAQQPRLASEHYPQWRSEIPGITTLQMAPEYWIWFTDNFRCEDAKERFSGFVQYVVMNLSSKKALCDLRPLLNRIEELAPSAQPADRTAMVALHLMFTGMIHQSARPSGRDAFLARWQAEREQCSIEMLAVSIIWGYKLQWPADACVEVFESYLRTRHKPKATYFPRQLEIALIAAIANGFFDGGDIPSYETWIDRAILDAAGNKGFQEHLRGCKTGKSRSDPQLVLGRPAQSSEKQADDPAISDVEIRERAYAIWKAAGERECDGVEYWLQAEMELRARSQSDSSPPE